MTALQENTKKVAFVTLGCKLNFAESSAMAQEFVKHGFAEVSPNKAADIYVVNTCTVTEHSDKKCRNLIRKVHRINPAAPIIVTGCYAELRAKELSEIEGVSLLVKQSGKGSILYKAQQLLGLETVASNPDSAFIFPASSFGERTRSFLKIQDGCDYFCTYCAIPFARGRSRSVAANTLVKQAASLAAKGVKEIVLTGINIGEYGKRFASSAEHDTFLSLLQKLNEVEGIERYRISSIEPNLLTDQIVEWIAGGTKFQPHFHIPLQSGSNSVLLRMKRKYDTQLFREKVEIVRSKMGDVFFGIDVIAGFPGETDQEFETTCSFLAETIKPAFLHIFPYSRRSGTVADNMPEQVKEAVKTRRVAALEQLSASLHAEYCARFKGTTQEVLFESSEKGGMMGGYTGNYIRVLRPFDPAQIGRIVKVVL